MPRFSTLAVLALLAFSGGCQKPPTPPLVRVGASLDSIEGHRVRSDAALAKSLPTATGATRDGIVAARGELGDKAMGADIKSARAATVDAGADQARVEKQLAKIESKGLVKLALRIDPWWRLVKWGVPTIILLAFALKVLKGAGIGGPIVGIAATALWAVVTGLMSLAKSFAGWIGAKWAARKTSKITLLRPVVSQGA